MWDPNIAKSEILERIANNAYVRHTTTQKLPLISVRDIVEKRIILKVPYKEDKVRTIIFSSSVPESLYPPGKSVVRAKNLFCIVRLTPLEDGRT